MPSKRRLLVGGGAVVLGLVLMMLLGNFVVWNNYALAAIKPGAGLLDVSLLFFSPPSSSALVEEVDGEHTTNDMHLVSTRARKYANSHCTMSTMNEDAWMTSMCSFVNLCYDPSLHSFVMYHAEGQHVDDLSEIGVNLGGGRRFAPVLKSGPLPVPRWEPNNGSHIWLLAELSQRHNELEHFVRDDLFAWWLLSANSLWQQLSGGRVLLLGPTQLSAMQMEWYDKLFTNRQRLVSAKSLNALRHPVCFPRAAAGLGSMTDHCSANIDHGFHVELDPRLGVTVASTPCSIGRISLFAELRHAMTLGASSPTSTEKFIDVLFIDSDTAPLQLAFNQLKLQRPDLVVELLQTSVWRPTADEQIRTALRVRGVLVTSPVGAHTVLAHFLPPGTGVVLMCFSKSI
ncbi:hypothetical protein BASA81_003654 [Batrachochytrium salamandrivorans]|nr:hypothetical protein BASA81_003654 [Batrachochytrium salamandrivorans]